MMKSIFNLGIKSNSLARRFVLYILLFSSVITLLATALQLYLDYSKDRQLLEASILDIETSYLKSIEASLWLTNEKLLMIHLQGIQQLPDMQYVAIHMDDGRTLAVGERKGNYLFEKQFSLNYIYRDKKIPLGTLAIVVTLEGIYNRLLERVWVILGAQAVKTFLVSLFIALLFYLLVGRHLYALADYAKSLNPHHLDNPAKLDRKINEAEDELDLLEHSLNEMQANLKNSYQDMDTEITRRKKAELVLTKREMQLRTLINTLPDLVWLKDPDGIYLLCNHKFESFYGAKESMIVGKTDYDFIDKELADLFHKNDLAAIAIGKPCTNEETLTFADDGHIETVETIKVPMLDSDGELIGILGIARNITGHKQLESELKKQHEHLEMMIIERTAELEKKNMDLERYNTLFLNREFRIKELKERVKELEAKTSPRIQGSNDDNVD